MIRRRLLGLLLGGVLLAGCALPGTRYALPAPDMASLDTLGYRHTKTEADRHAFFLSTVKPVLIEHWRAAAFPFGERRGMCFQGEARFCSGAWFPLGLPMWKQAGGESEHCGLQWYGGDADGVKVEPNLTKEIQANGYPYYVLEYHPGEQRALRWKCDLDPTAPGYPRLDNMAGY